MCASYTSKLTFKATLADSIALSLYANSQTSVSKFGVQFASQIRQIQYWRLLLVWTPFYISNPTGSIVPDAGIMCYGTKGVLSGVLGREKLGGCAIIYPYLMPQ